MNFPHQTSACLEGGGHQVGHGQIGSLSWLPRFDYEHEHRCTEHEHDKKTDHRPPAISEARELTQRQSKAADRGLRLHHFCYGSLSCSCSASRCSCSTIRPHSLATSRWTGVAILRRPNQRRRNGVNHPPFLKRHELCFSIRLRLRAPLH